MKKCILIIFIQFGFGHSIIFCSQRITQALEAKVWVEQQWQRYIKTKDKLLEVKEKTGRRDVFREEFREIKNLYQLYILMLYELKNRENIKFVEEVLFNNKQDLEKRRKNLGVYEYMASKHHSTNVYGVVKIRW